MQSVYLETTIPSYLTARPSSDLVTAAHQRITHEWWEFQRTEYDLYVSGYVVEEASVGDSDASQKRLLAIAEIPRLPSNDEVEWIAKELVNLNLVPPSASTDAFHIAMASAHAVDYLLTWNCRISLISSVCPPSKNSLMPMTTPFHSFAPRWN